jgi:hypothetical protein
MLKGHLSEVYTNAFSLDIKLLVLALYNRIVKL